MKIAIGLISIIFGMLLDIYGLIYKASDAVITEMINLKTGTSGMGMIKFTSYLDSIILVGFILIVVGCVVFERGIKEK